MPLRFRFFVDSAVLLFLCGCWASAGVEPLRTYTPRGQPLGAKICADSSRSIPIELWLIDPATGNVMARAPAAEGLVDLGALFPDLQSARGASVRAVQAVENGIPTGPALIIEPLSAPRRATDGLSAAANQALERDDRASLLKLLAEPESSRRALRQTVKLAPNEAGDPQSFALRCYIDQRVVLATGAGEIELELRPDAAPRTCFHFLQLVKGGFYDGTTFHRIVAADGRGRPFLIQGGDPIGTGAGGPGFAIDFEPSTLPHDFGVASMARQPNDPNSAGSQFFICLSREACAGLDGQYTSFARVVRGTDVLGALALTPVRTARGDAGSGPSDRPIEPPAVLSARAIPAPPMGISGLDPPSPGIEAAGPPPPVER